MTITLLQETYYALSETDLRELIRSEFALPTFEIPYHDWYWESASNASYACTTTTYDEAETERLTRYCADPAHYLDGESDYPTTPDWSEFLNELVRRGRIPQGNYLVSILP